MKVRDLVVNYNIFRAYDIRGKYPDEINENIAFRIGQAYGSYIQEKFGQTQCVVSHDNRLSSSSLAKSFIKGVNASGVDVVFLGLTTTPMNYFARRFFAPLMISCEEEGMLGSGQELVRLPFEFRKSIRLSVS